MTSKDLSQTVYIGAATPTPLGSVWVARANLGLVAVEIGTQEETFLRYVESLGFQSVLLETSVVAEPVRQLSEYLAGNRQNFDVQVDWSIMTPFQRSVLELVYAIPYGKTTTYGEIAHQLGKPHAARAVGRANAANPLALVIPCHRVIGSDGALRGYGAPGGVDTKAWLLRLEGWGRL